MYIPMIGIITIALATIGLTICCGLMAYHIIVTIKDIKRIYK